MVYGLLFSGCASVARVSADLVPVRLPDGHVIRAELAITRPQQARGLMYRAELPEDRGMLFVFTGDETQTIWMKHMRIPLDLVFLGPDRAIRAVYPSIPPARPWDADAEIPRYTAPARYVLELPAGTGHRHGLDVGRVLEFQPAR